ncbi:ATP-dependent DNA ligase [Pseudactinotalea suaedae]|uniref:ATP-dependent DNA ligase n=1 Tax=Pseudactinotalea suaedae TaxID=1524924 RepID=UPI001F4FD90A|nr:ATP-dependent DNA ligase [Pseudactinotalea suaedae]
MREASSEATVGVDGVQLRVTNLDKVLYPETGTTKADVLRYYAQIADVMVPHCADRAVTRKRWPNGVEGEVFFQKNLGGGTPHWVHRATMQHSDGEVVYPIANDRPTLAWLAQVAALELHVPQWRFDADLRPMNPDRIVFDLDPGPGVVLTQVAHVARLVKEILDQMGLPTYPVTSGSKGIHLYAPLDGSYTSAQTSALAKELARSLEADHRELVVSEMTKSARTGRVFLDWSQNNGNKTTICPYSLRGTTRPQVATPRTWAELEDPDLRHLELDEVLALVADRGDPMGPIGRPPGVGAGSDRLSTYRAKRDAARTPEPVPEAHGSDDLDATVAREFVIQEHHASRLHWDLRLARHGVLVSWALPKGVPDDPDSNHLAVQTEDHPMEYATFSGTIPAGEYGAGEMTIWDSGTYTTSKWRDGKEVIVTLTGRQDGGLAQGPGRTSTLALIRTGENWLIHLMDPTRQKKRATPSGVPRTRREVLPKPMMATLADALPDEPGWSYEMKWDGVRAIVEVEGDRVRLMSRSGRDQTAQYPELSVLPDLVAAHRAVLDGEIVALDDEGRPSFSLLQPRMQATKEPEIARAAQRRPVHLMLFDVLEVEETSLTAEPYVDRRDALEALVTEQGIVHVPPTSDHGSDALSASADLGLEGVVAKRRDSRYSPGRRSPAWLKLKHTLAQEVVVIGWREGGGNRAGKVGSLLLGVPGEDGALRYVGRVGSGFTERETSAWLGRFEPLQRADSPAADVPALDAKGAHWLDPVQVAEVEFGEWSPAGRLRHPRWRGWRPDKSVADISSH